MSEQKNSSTPPQGKTPDGKNDSDMVKDHRALMNQSSTKPEKYPEEECDAQSLVQKSKRRDQPD